MDGPEKTVSSSRGGLYLLAEVTATKIDRMANMVGRYFGEEIKIWQTKRGCQVLEFGDKI